LQSNLSRKKIQISILLSISFFALRLFHSGKRQRLSQTASTIFLSPARQRRRLAAAAAAAAPRHTSEGGRGGRGGGIERPTAPSGARPSFRINALLAIDFFVQGSDDDFKSVGFNVGQKRSFWGCLIQKE